MKSDSNCLRIPILVFISLWLVSYSRPGFSAMSVEEAYQAIPHQRTVFDKGAATMNPQERDFLDEFFWLTDMGILVRVEALKGGNTPEETAARYQKLEAKFQDLKVPGPLRKVYDLVEGAVKDQRDFLALSPRPDFHNHRLIQSASGKLHQAYSELMKLYPKEGQNNKQAFYDYLCALDFV